MILKGHVLDNNMRPILGVNIYALNENRSTTSNEDGYFEIPVNSTSSQVRFDHVAYDYDTITVKDFNSYIELYPKNVNLDEVIINNTKKESSNSLLLILLGIIAIGTIAVLASKKEPVKTKPRKVKA